MQIGRIWHALFAVALVAAMTVAVAPQRATAAACTCTMFGNSTPVTADDGDSTAIKVGFTFSSEVDGYITGMRFYKSAANTGTHIGELWAYADVSHSFQLAQVTFTGETASGWQTASFSKPVKIFASQIYTVTYTAPNGHYSDDVGGFGTLPNNSPLHGALQGGTWDRDTTLGGSAFPRNFSTSNYWVDVNFEYYLNETSLFNMTSAMPAVPTVFDSANYEIGTRFSSDVNTEVKAVRFWANTTWWQDYAVNIWRSDGTLLGSGASNDVRGLSGWFEVPLNTPVQIAAGTEYVASYHYDGGNAYGYTSGYFSSAYTRGPYHAPVNAGVYKVTSSSAFPNVQTSNNYWVDPVFTPVASVSVNANIAPNLTMTLGSHTGSCNGVSQTAGTSSTASLVSLGRLGAASANVAAQDVAVSTNAANGFTLHTRYSGTMNDGSGHSISNVSGSNSSPASFPSLGTSAFGYTTNDSALSNVGNGPARFTSPSAKWAALTTSNSEVGYSATGTSSKTICIAYQAGASASTQAGNYSTTVIYTLVPSF